MDEEAKNVLVVEDELLFSAYLDRILQDAGYSVLGPYPDTMGALEVIGNRTPPVHCAILDFTLSGGETSLGIALELREIGVPFLFLTGGTPLWHEGESIPADVPVLSKPVRRTVILECVQDLIVNRVS